MGTLLSTKNAVLNSNSKNTEELLSPHIIIRDGGKRVQGLISIRSLRTWGK